MLVEAKALRESLEGKWANKIMGYAGTCGVTWVVLTNGDEYRIYNAGVPVLFEQKLFRSVRLTKPDDRAEETLALLSKERIDDLAAQWQIHFADSQVHAAIGKFFSPAPDPCSSGPFEEARQGLDPQALDGNGDSGESEPTASFF